MLKSFDFEAILGSKKLRKEFAQPNGWGYKHTLKISKLFQKFLEVVKYLQKKNFHNICTIFYNICKQFKGIH